MGEWMALFAAVLQHRDPSGSAPADDDESAEGRPLERLQAAVLENINLYVEKYEVR